MAKPTRRRWKCQLCEDVVLAPTRPRRDDVRRFCLDCSKKTGRLVERVCPTLDAKRAKKNEKRAARRKSDAEKRAADPLVRLRKLFRKWKKWDGWTRDLTRATLRLSRGTSHHSSGHCYTVSQSLHVTVGTDWEDAKGTLVHELTHAALPANVGHGDKFRSLLNDAMIHFLGRAARGIRN